MVLIIALWALFFLGALALAIASYVRPQLELAGRVKGATSARFLAQAGVKRAMAQISNSAGAADTLELLPGGPFNFKPQGLADGEFGYELADEERKININTAPYNIIENLFVTVAHLDTQQAGDLAAAVLDWREPGEIPRKNGAKSDYYRTLATPYPCKDGPFEVIEELLLVKGMTPDIFNAVKNEITIYGAGSVNINTADTSVFETLGMSPALADEIINFRKTAVFSNEGGIVSDLESAQKPAKEDIIELTNLVDEGLLCFVSDNFRGTAYGKDNRDSMAVDFVFTRGKGIRFWREE